MAPEYQEYHKTSNHRFTNLDGKLDGLERILATEAKGLASNRAAVTSTKLLARIYLYRWTRICTWILIFTVYDEDLTPFIVSQQMNRLELPVKGYLYQTRRKSTLERGSNSRHI